MGGVFYSRLLFLSFYLAFSGSRFWGTHRGILDLPYALLFGPTLSTYHPLFLLSGMTPSDPMLTPSSLGFPTYSSRQVAKEMVAFLLRL